ncbi:glycoside hydrolase family 13 protein [Marmoricola sp. OAE513]|uniref:glycoside hydrolase family 13 protein n=1 Tax=Marmoricola sp. OAE513 TaxID=2817894 RepID=UPI001AE94232
MSHLLHRPHHDGSPLYTSAESAPLGRAITVRVRTSTHDPVDAVWLRTVRDGEPFFDPCTRGATDGADIWWTASVPVHNPTQRYRFMIVTGETFRWLNASGVVDHDVPDAQDFTVSAYGGPPAWGRDAVVYQVFPDRFARSAAADVRPIPEWAVPAQWDDAPIHQGPHTPLQFYGGDLDGITEHLDHLVDLGVDTLYLTPVFPGESNHRYNASTFDEVDELLGGDEAYRRLVDATHDRGLKILGDLTSNHTGDTHEWFLKARSDKRSQERKFYFFSADGSYETWKGHHTLPKLDHASGALGDRFRRVVARWLEFGLDGWRIDVANMTGRLGAVDRALDVAREIREAAVAVDPEALVLAEHGHDATGDLAGDGWHGTMNYYGFSFPVWEWLRDPRRPTPSFGLPVDLPRRGGAAMVAAMQAFTASFGWRATQASWNILGSHDSPRIRTITGSAALHHLAAVLQFTLPGVPMIFAGDELGLEGVNGEDSRRTMPWGDEIAFKTRTRDVYRALAALRREHVALTRGSLRWAHVAEDEVAFLREHESGTLLVQVRRTPGEFTELPGIVLEEHLFGLGETGPTPRAAVWSVRPNA